MVFLHTVCSLLSYAAFLVAFASGALFLTQERQVKRRTMGVLFHALPSLEMLDRINFLALGVGFGLLTFGLGCGVIELRIFSGRWWITDPKSCLALILWCSYLLLWVMRWRSTMRGRRVAQLSVLGFGLVLFTFLGISYVVPSLHPYL